ncbi:hypothetical protein ebA4183 [Aromatoleum aromaticum EbN1]|uniref:Uncharacterized protein n=1 Tax=Aromatoleum aromaticum (strain DSM 19018 / LMG 30748 / EbN1) TaxID=76114 RepID=Q5P2H2_AROAE|nr:hypothetical protein ebA4183 [Aromatoleum aromaticum EbN1]
MNTCMSFRRRNASIGIRSSSTRSVRQVYAMRRGRRQAHGRIRFARLCSSDRLRPFASRVMLP